MTDSMPSKQIKSHSVDIDTVLENNLAEIASELEKREGHASPVLSQEGLEAPENNMSLDDFLAFDAKVLASNQAETVVNKSDNEFAESIDNQQPESEIEEFITQSEPVEEIEQQDRNSIKINIQNKRMLHLESELSDLNKKLETQAEDNKASEKSSAELKKISIFALIVALLALLVSFWNGALNSDMPTEKGEMQRLTKGITEHIVVPVVKPDHQKIENLKTRPEKLDLENIKPEKILVVPEDDISDISATRQKEVVNTNTAVSEWAVNLNSYEQLWKADKKIEELQRKGIVSEMIIVNVKGVRWYRIRVTGFKTKAEAESYVLTIKKMLNINHVWVSKK